MAKMPMPGIAMPPSKPSGPLAPPPDMPGGDEEPGETCNATVTSDQLQELQDQGTVTLQADSGESVVLTMDQGQSADQGAPEAPDGGDQGDTGAY